MKVSGASLVVGMWVAVAACTGEAERQEATSARQAALELQLSEPRDVEPFPELSATERTTLPSLAAR